MVRAILDGRKTQTRRVVKQQPVDGQHESCRRISLSEYVAGRLMWVRETWQYANWTEDGEPYIQGPGDPRPGYYVSKTSLQDETKAGSDPRRYANASVIPYVTLPYNQLGGARLGDFAVVVNRSNGQLSYAIFAGFGPPRFLAVCSIALADALGIPSSTRHGGAYGGVAYVVFPQSGNGKPRPVEEIDAEAAKLFEAWGGMKQLEACFSR